MLGSSLCRGRAKMLVLALLSVPLFIAATASASATIAAPGWQVTTRSYPTNLSPGGTGNLKLELYNIGAAPSTGTVVLTDTLPPGLKAIAAGKDRYDSEIVPEVWGCTGIGTRVVTCETAEGASIGVGVFETIGIKVEVEPGAAGVEQNQVTVSGGGAPNPASSAEPLDDQRNRTGIRIGAFQRLVQQCGRNG